MPITTPRLAVHDETDQQKMRSYRAALLTEARTLVDRAEAETRALTPSEALSFEELRAEIDRADTIRRDLETGRRAVEAELRAFVAGNSSHTSRETRAASWLPSFSEYHAGLETRAVPPQNEAVGSEGGFIVPVQAVGQIFDRLRTLAVFLAAGPRIVNMESMTATLPVIGTSVSVAMVPENTPIPASGLLLKSAGLRARKAAALAVGSNEWFQDSNPSAREVLAFDMERQLAAKIDEQALVGDGLGENLLGIFNTAGITETPAAGPLTLDVILAALGAVEARGALPSAIFLNPVGWAALTSQKDTSEGYLLNPTPAEAVSRRLFGVPVFTSPAVPVAQALVGDMSHVAFGWRQQIRLSYDHGGNYFIADQTAVRAIARFDVAVLNVAALEKVSGITALEATEPPPSTTSGVSGSTAGAARRR